MRVCRLVLDRDCCGEQQNISRSKSALTVVIAASYTHKDIIIPTCDSCSGGLLALLLLHHLGPLLLLLLPLQESHLVLKSKIPLLALKPKWKRRRNDNTLSKTKANDARFLSKLDTYYASKMA